MKISIIFIITTSALHVANSTPSRLRQRAPRKEVFSEEEPPIAGIVNGEVLPRSKKPGYLLSLGVLLANVTYLDLFFHVCGASLISPSIVLTAAHCFYVDGKWNPIHYVDFNIYDLTDRSGTINYQLRDLAKDGDNIQIHPDYDPYEFGMDFALIILDEPMTSIESVAINDNPDVPSPGDELFVSGWGANKDVYPPFNQTDDEENAYPNVPYFAEVNYLTNKDCEGGQEGQDDSFGWGKKSITDDMLCTLGDEVSEEQAWNPYFNRKGICSGDSGTPLIKNTDQGPVQVGIGSFGFICGDPYTPDGHARVSAVSNWIKEWIEKIDPSVPPTPSPTLYLHSKSKKKDGNKSGKKKKKMPTDHAAAPSAVSGKTSKLHRTKSRTIMTPEPTMTPTL